MVAGFDVEDAITDLFDDARSLMSHHRRSLNRVETFDEVQVGVTHPGGHRLDQDFIRLRIIDRDVFDRQRFVDCLENCCLGHLCLPFECGAVLRQFVG